MRIYIDFFIHIYIYTNTHTHNFSKNKKKKKKKYWLAQYTIVYIELIIIIMLCALYSMYITTTISLSKYVRIFCVCIFFSKKKYIYINKRFEWASQRIHIKFIEKKKMKNKKLNNENIHS